MPCEWRAPGEVSVVGTTPGVGEMFGRYQVEQELGRGGMGVVHLALDTQLGRRVALKTVSGELAGDAAFLERFHTEAEILTRLDSPHVITIYEHGEIAGVPYLAMQYVPGGDLRGLLGERGPVPPAMAARICAQVAGALHDAHEAGVIHRDVKTANVLLRDPGAAEPFAYLTDFGIAKSSHRNTDGQTVTGNVAGSWAYLSPERTRGEPASRASDIYALGCLFYACLTGHTPYEGSDVEIAIAHVTKPIRQIPGDSAAGSAINHVLRRAMAKDPSDRYATAEELRQDLVALPLDAATPLLASAPEPSTPERSSARGAKVAALVAGVLALVLVGVGATWALTRDGKGDAKDSERDPKAAAIDPADVVVGDWTGDGVGDVRLDRSFFNDETINRDALPLQLWAGTAQGTFEGPTEDMGAIESTHSGDVNGDGRLDLVHVEESEDETSVSVRIWPGTAEGPGQAVEQTLALDSTINTDATYGLGDFNGDGRDDLLLPVNRQDDYMALTVSLSNGETFDAPVEFGWRGGRDNTSDELGVGDFDGDGMDDLFAIVANRKSKGLRFKVFRSDGTTFERTSSTTIEDGRYNQELSDFVAADVDGDGVDELVSMVHMLLPGKKTYGHGITVTEWANGSFVTPTTWLEPSHALEAYSTPSIGVSDVDGDGKADIVQLADLDWEDDVFDLLWFRSTGAAFEDAVTAASPPCLREECSETAEIIGNSR